MGGVGLGNCTPKPFLRGGRGVELGVCEEDKKVTVVNKLICLLCVKSLRGNEEFGTE